ncbi:lipopolysaccharide biosynthesis protein [Paraburkholderia xenovorans]|uniref:lipopolysaccharide biosynthesis protein n=1 Tax=Paraburkholderia xenovorans TaxID=36873 RepID=UPI0038BB0681
MFHRISLGLGANLFGQVVTVAIQLLSLPIFLQFWSLSRYGEWLMLSAIPAYLSAMDVGILSVGMNRMAILAAGGDVASAERIFQSMLAFALAAIAVVGAIVLPGLWLFSFGDSGVSVEHRVALSLLIGASLACVLSGLFESVFRACDDYPMGIIALNLGRVAEWLGSIVGLVVGRSLADVGIGYFLGRLIANLLTWLYIRHRYPQYRWSISGASKAELTSMVVPGLSYISLPAANALSLQGMVLLVGSMFGTPTLAIFSAYRTLARICFQAVNMLTRVLWPEFSRRYGEGAFATMRGLYRYGTMATIVASIGGALVLYVAGPFVIKLWTHGRIAYIPHLFNILLLVTAFSGLWQVGLILLTAVNKLGAVSIIYVVASALSLGCAFLAGRSYGLEGAALAMILTEVAMAGTCYLYVKAFFDEHSKSCSASLVTQ